MSQIGDHGPIELDIIRSSDGDATVLTLSGELDMATTPDLARALDGSGSPPRIVLDLSGVTFIDSTGLAALIAAHEDAAAEGRLLAVWRLSPQTRRVFELTGVLPGLTLIDH